VAAIVCFWWVLSLSLQGNPARSLERLAELPLIGRLVESDRILTSQLQVVDLVGGLDYIRDNQLAYVVSGKAVNRTGQDLRIMEIEGGLVVNGSETRRQRVYAGNQARATIRDLSASEVEMLLRLEPNRRFRIRPDESATFLLVFPDPPSGFEEVRVRIVDARAS
jgi:hypothetical protein